MSYLRDSGRLIDFAVAHRTISGGPFDFEGHEYLKGLYLEEEPVVVVRKAAQMGASEYGITRALFFAVRYGGRVIYYFPTDHDVTEFSQDRFRPALKDSPYLSALMRDTDTTGLKKIGRGSIYFRGTTGRTRMKSVPADFLIFDEVDEMIPENLELARKRLGHSAFGHELYLSTPTLPGYGIDQIYEESDQRHYLLRCPGCSRWHCLEDEFLQAHGSPRDVREEIVFVKGRPGYETLICTRCGHALDPGTGAWAARHPGRRSHGYSISKFASTALSAKERALGAHTKPAALLAQWKRTRFPAEFFNSELGLPYLAAEGGLSEHELLGLVGDYPLMATGRGCVMGVDQGSGLHIVIKEPTDDDYLLTVYVHHEPLTDERFTYLDHLMGDFDVRACVIDALPNTHAARAFARRFSGRVYLSYYNAGKGRAAFSFDTENTPVVSVNRTEAFDAWRDGYKQGLRRIPRVEGPVGEYVRQMTNILRAVREDPTTGAKRAVWIKRGPDHYAHADSYAELARKRSRTRYATATILG